MYNKCNYLLLVAAGLTVNTGSWTDEIALLWLKFLEWPGDEEGCSTTLVIDAPSAIEFIDCIEGCAERLLSEAVDGNIGGVVVPIGVWTIGVGGDLLAGNWFGAPDICMWYLVV